MAHAEDTAAPSGDVPPPAPETPTTDGPAAPPPPEAPDPPPAPSEPAPAEADDDDDDGAEIFVGGGLQARGGFAPASGYAGNAEVEADLLAEAGILSARVDLDVTVAYAPAFAVQTALPDVPVIDTVRPEWAMLQLGGDSWLVHGGIYNTAYGLDDWDDWSNYMPTKAAYYNTSAGRMAGGEVGWVFGDDGPSVMVGGGWDLDYDAPMAAGAVNVEAESWSTWSGLGAYPTLGQYEAIIGAEVYPAEILTIAFGGMAGVAGMLDGAAGSPFVLGSVYLVALPEGMVNPTLRVEGAFDPDGYTGAAPWGVGLGGAAAPFDWSKFLLEGKVNGNAGGISPGVYFSLCVFRPEPEDDDDDE